MSYNRPGVNKAGQRASIQAHGRSSTSNVDDHDLVKAARKGDRDAFKTLFERYHRRAYALAFGVLRHPDDALDVVQDAFIKAHKYLDKFEGNSSFYTWLYRIVMNLAIDHLRKHRRVKPVELDESRIEDGENPLLPKILGGNPGRALMDKQIRTRIDQALDELSENHRSVLVMRELEGLSYEEMAQTMGCSKGTIMSRLFHARKNMQKRLIDLVENPSKELLAELGMKAEDVDAPASDDDAAASGAGR
ncbi:MAG: sigma-70 family RNA polymerase sigma factor [Myxococcota bacterium]|nr:sigma-70 family RNA polymerase sigma factor [Myxococcota bacterium]